MVNVVTVAVKSCESKRLRHVSEGLKGYLRAGFSQNQLREAATGGVL